MYRCSLQLVLLALQPPAHYPPPRVYANTPTPTLPRNRNSQRPPIFRRLSVSIASLSRIVPFPGRGINDTAGIPRASSLVTRFTSDTAALRLVFHCSLQQRRLRIHYSRADTPLRPPLQPISPSLQSRSLADRIPTAVVLDAALCRHHVASGHPFIHSILRRIRAIVAIHPLDAPHQEHPARYLPWRSFWRLGLLRKWRFRL